jgi:hypothetical protein
VISTSHMNPMPNIPEYFPRPKSVEEVEFPFPQKDRFQAPDTASTRESVLNPPQIRINNRSDSSRG